MLNHSLAAHRFREEVMYFRFAVAPAFGTYCNGRNEQGLSLDYALPKDQTGAPILPPATADSPAPLKRLRYGHFGCNVVHEDLAYPLGADVHAAKMAIKKVIEAGGGKLPAEHGHGTEYKAPTETRARWEKMDPTNSLNPGVGGLSYDLNYGKSVCCGEGTMAEPAAQQPPPKSHSGRVSETDGSTNG